jgi:UDP-N-acetylmuramoyl-tripeptide--D-alanyl-D-alanine ligase
MFFYFLGIPWFIREIKTTLFWIYLWQLKEYHIGRFLDHFRTYKGKKIFLNFLFLFKIFLLFYALFFYFYHKLVAWQFYAFWIIVLMLFYIFESVKFFIDILPKKINPVKNLRFLNGVKKPVLTPKTASLTLVGLIFEIIFLYFLFQKAKFLYWFSFGLLSFDLLTPFLVSGIVLFFQPFTVLLRNQIIKKAKEKREEFKDLIVIGITGSYGKTSTKEFLAEILSKKYNVLKTKEHQNSEIGIAQCILNELKPEHEIFISEVGAYNRGKIKEVCQFLKPKIGILTGINEQHMATFGSQENIIEAKFELIENLPEDGIAIFNGENIYCQELYQKTQPSKKIIAIKPYSNIATEMNIWTKDIRVEKEFIYFKVFSKDYNSSVPSQSFIGGWTFENSADFRVNLLGEKNIENILMAAACAKEVGMTLGEISEACQKIKPLPHQMELKKGKNDLNIIDATYSANPDGVISHLEYLKIWPQKKIIVMPCLIELGRASKEVHKKIGKKITEVCDLAIITTRDRFKEIVEGALLRPAFAEATAGKQGFGGREIKKDNILFLENPKEIFEKLKDFCQPGDVILLESRVPNQLINFLTQ